ncbi:uncharacterized protein LOC109714125 isoform X4 [Ananas comosus]|uniref:Dirigent protein n=1 Tax=Ananas comosus TaxID=4615 RepID=A0A6P5FM24_ANACO|nr:uncharacterized protein LOC109714125 isoform X4 [Ananas comosus]
MFSPPSNFASSFFLLFFLFSISHGFDTHLHFYFHEIVSGPNKTSFIVAGPNLTSHEFGDIVVFDNALRVGPDPNSKLIGRAQGMSVLASLSDQSVLTPINFVFTEGEYKGSTLTLFGRVPASGTAERTVVGGTGQFRLARGYAISSVLPEPLTGKVWKLDDFESYPALLVMFICNHCPFVKHLKKDIVKLTKFYMGKGLAAVAISSNSTITHPQDGPEFMAKEAKLFNYPFPYLFDEDGRRPFELFYHGQFDDSRPSSNIPVTGRFFPKPDLSRAIDCVLSGQKLNFMQKPRFSIPAIKDIRVPYRIKEEIVAAMKFSTLLSLSTYNVHTMFMIVVCI